MAANVNYCRPRCKHIANKENKYPSQFSSQFQLPSFPVFTESTESTESTVFRLHASCRCRCRCCHRCIEFRLVLHRTSEVQVDFCVTCSRVDFGIAFSNFPINCSRVELTILCCQKRQASGLWDFQELLRSAPKEQEQEEETEAEEKEQVAVECSHTNPHQITVYGITPQHNTAQHISQHASATHFLMPLHAHFRDVCGS